MFSVLISSFVGSVQKGPVVKIKLSGRAGKLKKEGKKVDYCLFIRQGQEV